jgi:hypothetical protein
MHNHSFSLSLCTLVCTILGQHCTSAACLQVNSEISRVQNSLDEVGVRCRNGGVGNALIHHSTITECDRTRASYVDTRFARDTQVASQGTAAVNVRNVDTAMHRSSASAMHLGD